MNLNQISIHSSFSLSINGEKCVLYEGNVNYTLRWENRMENCEGTLEADPFKLRLKIKHGKIHKFIKLVNETDLFLNSMVLFRLPNIKIINIGNSYKEEDFSTEKLSFLIKKNLPLFNGRPYPIQSFIDYSDDLWQVVTAKIKDSNSAHSVIEFINEGLRFYGYSLNFTPYGDFKIIYEYIKIKTNFKGFFINGPCELKYPDYTLIYDINFNIISLPFKLIFKDSGGEMEFTPISIDNKDKTKLNFKAVTKDLNLKYALPLDEISSSIMQSYSLLESLTKTILFHISSKLLTYLLVVDTDWKIFEIKIKDLKKNLTFFPCKKDQVHEVDEKNLESFPNNERYEGGLINRKFEGFGKYYYTDGSVYIGEFKNNLRNGIGNFRFKDGRMYRGYWIDNLMHGKGCMVSEKVRIYGIWEKNKLKHESICNIYNRINSLE